MPQDPPLVLGVLAGLLALVCCAGVLVHGGTVYGLVAEGIPELGWPLVPLIPAMGLIGAPVFLVGVSGVMLGFTEQVSVVYGVSVIPIALWELSLGLWLAFKGFNPSAPILAAAPAVDVGPHEPLPLNAVVAFGAVDR